MGLGLPPPTPSWGELLRQAESYYTFAWWVALFPSLALFSTLLSLNFLGDGLREALRGQSIAPVHQPRASVRQLFVRWIERKAHGRRRAPVWAAS
jgi:hypothetical protein